MSTTSPSTDRWVVSTRVAGEVLTAEAHVAGLELRLLGLPQGFSQAEAEGWIGSLAASALEGAGAAIPDDPLPPPLRQALSGLLFSHAELWQTGGTLGSVALMRDVGRVAFGWIGSAAVEIEVEGERVTPEWTLVRDHLGGEARAWSGDASRETRVVLVLEGENAQVTLEAQWPGTDAVQPAASTNLLGFSPGEEAQPEVQIAQIAPATGEAIADVPESEALIEEYSAGEEQEVGEEYEEREGHEEEESQGLEEEESQELEEEESQEPVSQEEALPSHGVARWLARLGQAKQSETETPALEAAESVPEAEPEPVAAEADPLPPEVPDRIPPSPEPEALTARAVREDVPLEDPRAIVLPEPGAAGAEGVQPAEPASNPQWAATLDALGAREPQGMSPAIRERLRRSRTQEGGWEPLEIETLASPGGWTGAESATIPTPPPEPEPADGEARHPGAAKRGIPRRPDWPAAPPTDKPVAWGRWAFWTGFVLLLFGAGWMMGAFQNNDAAGGRPSTFALLLRQIGLGGARFDAHVGSHPPGARILVDGKDTNLRTPATLSLPPGAHHVELSLGPLGGATVEVTGQRGQDVSVNAPLWGSVEVAASDPNVPVAIAVDGVARGFVPATIDSLSPGPHELRFTGPGMASWGTAVEVHVGEKKDVLAYPLQSPATGLLQVRAMATVEGDHQSLDGARVSIDGKPRGVTPLTLELQRGPHSVRVTNGKDEAPIQVIDLPGGNQRFATFELGLPTDFPRIELRVPPQFSLEDPVLVSATVRNVAAKELREMWLHVRSTDGSWRRYEMTMLEAQTGAVGAAPFPAAALSSGPAPYYVSALTAQGDEVFTEMQSAVPASAAPSPKR